MVEFLFKVCTRRNLGLALALTGVLFAADRLQEYPRRWYREWRYPPQQGASPGGAEIMSLMDKRAAADVVRRYELVLAHLSQARAEGFEVSVLERKAAVALQLNGPRYRRQALEMLAEVELRVPHKKVQYIPLCPADEEVEIPEDVPGKRVGPGGR